MAVLTVTGTGFGAYIMAMAALSPCPLLINHDLGAALIVRLTDHTHMLSIGDSCSIFCKHSFRPVNVTVYTGTGIYLVTLKNSKGHLIVGYYSLHLLEIQHIQDVQCKVLHTSEQM